jgi:hypothetical protein
MQAPMTAVARRSQLVHPLGPIRCAVVFRPTEAQKQKRAILRYVVLGIALLAVAFLIATAVFYTEGHSVTIHHVSSLAPHFAWQA